MDGNTYPSSSSRVTRPRPNALDKDTQLLQDLMSLLLSSPAQPTTGHRGATPLSASPFFQELDFPMEYSKNYVSQGMGASSQEQKKKSSKQLRPDDEGESWEVLQKISFFLWCCHRKSKRSISTHRIQHTYRAFHNLIYFLFCEILIFVPKNDSIGEPPYI